ncbi:bifunctional methylenetetrahydrofolate dehydrogenase/cyclohydrolase, mitochondrial [Cephus cinctus]|uniref:methenyltetrahydrofolate cyclohydrolase n=1 Tax=Cephus cinctus TaxID=211228 RepID=A0AAJ7BYL2_CEPCN|nr:bifunctional methylenetetrahydrofolate dehydrogenase/cyclohydrolase, mitochondrial [Cephus cinctus]
MFSRRLLSLIINTQHISRELHVSKSLLTAVIINGKAIAEEMRRELKSSVDAWVACDKRQPKLIAILVGDDQASKTYVGNKVRAAAAIGILSETIFFGNDISQTELIEKIKCLNNDDSVDGIIVQLPLPIGIEEKEICCAVAPSKDVDGFHIENMGKLTLDRIGIAPATALGVKELILRSKIDTIGKNAVIVGRSKHVGLPIALLLHADGKGETGALDMTTTICHRFTPHEQMKNFTKSADVIVMAAGVPGLLTKDMVKPGACVIDVGINRIKDNTGGSRLVGDVDFESVKKVAGYITPVPGGVGPMTVTMLMKNTFLASKRNQGER